jgi:hypothetical protein
LQKAAVVVFGNLARTKKGAEMPEEKRAALYTSPGGKFIREDTLPRILAHWRSFRSAQRRKHCIKYEDELYAGEEADKLQMLRS